MPPRPCRHAHAHVLAACARRALSSQVFRDNFSNEIFWVLGVLMRALIGIGNQVISVYFLDDVLQKMDVALGLCARNGGSHRTAHGEPAPHGGTWRAGGAAAAAAPYTADHL